MRIDKTTTIQRRTVRAGKRGSFTTRNGRFSTRTNGFGA